MLIIVHHYLLGLEEGSIWQFIDVFIICRGNEFVIENFRWRSSDVDYGRLGMQSVSVEAKNRQKTKRKKKNEKETSIEE